MILNPGRESGRIICASVLAGVLLVFGVCFASASAWNPSARFFSENCLYTFVNALKIADCTAICDETSRARPRDRMTPAPQLYVTAFADFRFFESRSETTPRSGTAGTIFEKPEPDGADMVSLE